MRLFVCMSAMSFFALIVCGISSAENIVLEGGEKFTRGDLEVICIERRSAREPLVLKDCQRWDDYSKKCIYERKKYVYDGRECVEECQHWDEYKKKCDYATTCLFHPSQEAFVLQKCEEFDEYAHTCIRIKESLISR